MQGVSALGKVAHTPLLDHKTDDLPMCACMGNYFGVDRLGVNNLTDAKIMVSFTFS